MRMVARIKEKDTVVVISGKDKDQQGVVIDIDTKHDKVLVKGVGIVTRHVKARKQGDIAGIKKQEAYLKMSQVMPICSSCKKACRVMTKIVAETGKRSRACNRCKEIM